MESSQQVASLNKDPWLAVNLSRLLPGLGQIYARKVPRGVIILILSLLSYAMALYTLFSVTGSFIVGIGLILFQFALWIWSMRDAHQCVSKFNSEEYEKKRRQNKNPWIAIFWSGFLPGLGHFYLRKKLIGTLLFLSSLVFLMIPVIGTIWTCFIIYITYRNKPENRERNSKIIIQFIFIFFIFSLINQFTPLLIRSYIAEARYIPSGAMEPSLQINDRVIIEKISYRYHEPDRGDIVVFNPTEILRSQGVNNAYIKRIIGIPGDRVEIKQGGVYVNAQRLAEPYVPSDKPTSVEFCNTPAFLAKPVTIPKNNFLMLGDNRTNAYDGRCWGLVKKEEIIGKANKIFYPFNRAGAIPSPDFPGFPKPQR